MMVGVVWSLQLLAEMRMRSQKLIKIVPKKGAPNGHFV